jgi:hypothetical protein
MTIIKRKWFGCGSRNQEGEGSARVSGIDVLGKTTVRFACGRAERYCRGICLLLLPMKSLLNSFFIFYFLFFIIYYFFLALPSGRVQMPSVKLRQRDSRRTATKQGPPAG